MHRSPTSPTIAHICGRGHTYTVPRHDIVTSVRYSFFNDNIRYATGIRRWFRSRRRERKTDHLQTRRVQRNVWNRKKRHDRHYWSTIVTIQAPSKSNKGMIILRSKWNDWKLWGVDVVRNFSGRVRSYIGRNIIINNIKVRLLKHKKQLKKTHGRGCFKKVKKNIYLI